MSSIGLNLSLFEGKEFPSIFVFVPVNSDGMVETAVTSLLWLCSSIILELYSELLSLSKVMVVCVT